MKYDYENVMEYAVEQATKQAAEKAKAKGKAEGLAEGEARKGLEIARNLLSMGLSAEQIVRATGLSSAEVSALR